MSAAINRPPVPSGYQSPNKASGSQSPNKPRGRSPVVPPGKGTPRNSPSPSGSGSGRGIMGRVILTMFPPPLQLYADLQIFRIADGTWQPFDGTFDLSSMFNNDWLYAHAPALAPQTSERLNAREIPVWVQAFQVGASQIASRLGEIVAIPSVSGDASYRPSVLAMGEWLYKALVGLGVETTMNPLGKHTMDNAELDLPPVICGTYGSDPAKKTILVYGHYDVQPSLKEDGWNTEPFEMHHDLKSGRLYGRGTTDDKGPVLAWLSVIEAHQVTGTEFPVNLKMCFEGMEESGSVGLEAFVEREKDAFFAGLDAICISDNYWLTTTTPALTYGLRGLMYQKVTISGPSADLHSGVFGGTVHEPMIDLFHLFSKLSSPKGEILVPGVKELVAPLTDEEKARYVAMDFETSDLESAVGSKTLLSDDKAEILMGRMRNPSLSIHGIEGAFSAAGSKTVIPAKVHGKYSIRLVPNQTPDVVASLCTAFLEGEFAKLNSKNTLTIETLHGGKPWVSDVNHWNYRAASTATEKVYKKKPDLTREGGSIPVTLCFQDVLKKNVILLPMGRSDDGAHSVNEKLDVSNYIQGTILLGEYLHEVAKATSTEPTAA